jgi:glutamate carboxypeptidase
MVKDKHRTMSHTIFGYLQQHTPRYIQELAGWAAVESHTGDRTGVVEFAGLVRARLQALGLTVEPLGPGGARLLARRQAGEGAPILVIGHADTVYPRGTLAAQPVVERDGRLYGPGVFDMKGGLLALCAALEALQALGRAPRRPLMVLVTDDEEIGSPISRPYIEQVAHDAAAVLVLEPATPAGALKTARKGAGMFTLEITGRAAHAGVAPEEGRSALVELAHQILWLQSLNNPVTGTTVNVGQAQGGSATNVIPATATAFVDVRVRTTLEGERLAAIIAERGAVMPDVTVQYAGGIRNPPMERTAAIAALFEHARRCAHELGFSIEEAATGGGSDGNFTAALGIPTLDGLGLCGDGAHAPHEHIVVDEFPRRAALLARLIETL